MQSIKEFAVEQLVSYEAIRKKIKRYEKDLKGHIIKKGRTQYLDDDAINFLKEHMQEKQIIELASDQSEEIQRLKMENDALKNKVVQLQDKLISVGEELSQEKDQVKLLQIEKIELLEQKNKEPENVPEPEKKHWWSKIF